MVSNLVYLSNISGLIILFIVGEVYPSFHLFPSSNYLAQDLMCNGTEDLLSECDYNPPTSPECFVGNHSAAVVCRQGTWVHAAYSLTNNTHMRTHTHTHMHTHAYTHAHTCMHTHTHVCIHTHTHTHTHVCTHTHTHTHTHIHTFCILFILVCREGAVRLVN